MAKIGHIKPDIKLRLFSNTHYIFTLLIIAIFTLIPKYLFSEDTIIKGDHYIRLMNVYREWIELDQEVFKTLSFKLSEEQNVVGGHNPKFFLEDNIGRKWMFKISYRCVDVTKKTGNKEKEQRFYFDSIVIRNLYKLFGLYTPPIYIISLNLNGRLITGTIQKFIDNHGDLSCNKIQNISQDVKEYTLKAHVLDWVSQNSDAKKKHFIITETDDKGNLKKITRIDNGTRLFLEKEDVNIYWSCKPKEENCKNNYYNYIWKKYLSKQIDLDLDKNFEFIKYFADFPDYFLNEVVFNSNLFEQKQFSICIPRKEVIFSEYFRRKQTLIEDFKAFYSDLALKRNVFFYKEKKVNYKKITSLLVKKIEKDIKALKKEKRNIEKSSKYDERIDVIFSLEGGLLYKRIRIEYENQSDEGLKSKCNYALDILRKLKSEVSLRSIYEEKAIDEYIKEIERILIGEHPFVMKGKKSKFIKCITPNCIAE